MPQLGDPPNHVENERNDVQKGNPPCHTENAKVCITRLFETMGPVRSCMSNQQDNSKERTENTFKTAKSILSSWGFCAFDAETLLEGLGKKPGDLEPFNTATVINRFEFEVTPDKAEPN